MPWKDSGTQAENGKHPKTSPMLCITYRDSNQLCCPSQTSLTNKTREGLVLQRQFQIANIWLVAQEEKRKHHTAEFPREGCIHWDVLQPGDSWWAGHSADEHLPMSQLTLVWSLPTLPRQPRSPPGDLELVTSITPASLAPASSFDTSLTTTAKISQSRCFLTQISSVGKILTSSRCKTNYGRLGSICSLKINPCSPE